MECIRNTVYNEEKTGGNDMKKGEKLEKIIKGKYIGWSIARFAEHAGIKKTTLHDITKKESLDKVAIENIQLIAKALDMSIEELLFRLDNDIDYKEKIDYRVHETNEVYSSGFDETVSFLNYYGPVSAGKVECVEGIEKAEQIKLPKIFLGKYQDREDVFVMKVNGESMNKVLPVDSLITCLPIKNTHEVKNNDIVIFSYNNEIAVKRFKITDNNLIFSPQSTNDKFYDVVVPRDIESEVKIIAKVISYHVCLD